MSDQDERRIRDRHWCRQCDGTGSIETVGATWDERTHDICPNLDRELHPEEPTSP